MDITTNTTTRPRRNTGGANRTGTARWKRLRTQAIRRDQRNGVTHCPVCRGPIAWGANYRHPRAPQADHIIPHALGGKDTLDNIRIICRTCNQKLGGKLGGKRAHKNRATKRNVQPAKPITFDHSGRW